MWLIDIPKLRQLGLTRCCCVGSSDLSLYQALQIFGLRQDDDSLHEISAEQGQTILSRLLGTSLVDSIEAMPTEQVRLLTKEFIDAYREHGCRFFTNLSLAGERWSAKKSFTDSLFDGGVIAFGPIVSGCVWVEEDD
ncbi:MAG: hypothetical protein JNJ42_00930 [Burkholderiaceae bacterium]|nr:hypothetical protein [Burkholderiaceae bacterium]